MNTGKTFTVHLVGAVKIFMLERLDPPGTPHLNEYNHYLKLVQLSNLAAITNSPVRRNPFTASLEVILGLKPLCLVAREEQTRSYLVVNTIHYHVNTRSFFIAIISNINFSLT